MIDWTKIKIVHVKDAIYIITVILGVLFFFRDKAINQAVKEEQMQTVQKNQEEILKKLQDYDLRWDEQMEQNGKVNMYIILDSRQ
jgi:hypothetical protein